MRAKREQTALVDRQRSAVKFASIQPPAAPARAARPQGAPLQPARVRALPWGSLICPLKVVAELLLLESKRG